VVAIVQVAVQLHTRGAGTLDNEQQSILQLEAQEPASEAAASMSADQGQTAVPLLSDVANHAPNIDQQSCVAQPHATEFLQNHPSTQLSADYPG
jgi:hypothetical protein